MTEADLLLPLVPSSIAGALTWTLVRLVAMRERLPLMEARRLEDQRTIESLQTQLARAVEQSEEWARKYHDLSVRIAGGHE